MRSNAPTKTCCLVVGMHNSGTSLVGALLHAAGVPMGERLLLRHNIEPARRPRYDYFEDEDVVALQDATLLALQRHWSSYRSSFPLPSPNSEGRVVFRRQLTTVLKRRFKRQRLWLVKAPRSGALLSDWLTVLQELNVQPRLLIVHQDPASNIRSFSSKGQVPPLWAEALWQRTYANALSAAQELPSEQVWSVSFAELLRDPAEQARQLCTFLNWVPATNLSEQVAARFDPSLPTQADQPEDQRTLHPATSRLKQLLQERRVERIDEQGLLATQLAAALDYTGDPLNLNALHPQGQSLLPKLRVTIVTAELQGLGPSGGIGSAFRELAEALVAAGHPVRVLLVASGNEQPKQTPHGLQVERLDPSGLSRLNLCRAVASALQSNPGDVIHLHDWLGLGSSLKAALGDNSPPLIVGLHGPSAWARGGNPWPSTASPEQLYSEGLVRALEQDALEQADLLVSPSRFMANWVGEHLLNEQATIQVQRNCALSERRIHSKAQGTTERLVYFGRLEQRKGLLLFLDALELLPSPPSEVVFIGGDCRIAEQHWGSERVEQRLGELGIPVRIETSLDRDQALRRLQELAGVVVIPSLIENSPCVVEELLDSGLRLVSTAVGGTSELLSEGSRRWLSEPEPAALASHLHTAMQSIDPGAYELQAHLPGWQIALSWQAFHERLPRGQMEEPAIEGEPAPATPLRRSLRLARRVVQKLTSPALRHLR